MAELMNQMEKVQHRRKTLVSIGSAYVFNPPESSDYEPLWIDAIRAAARANVSMYVIDPNGLTGGHYDAARTVADATGGQAFVNSNLFERSVEQIWSEAGHYYLLGYEPPTSKARTHTIEVRVKRSGLQVRARRTRAQASISFFRSRSSS